MMDNLSFQTIRNNYRHIASILFDILFMKLISVTPNMTMQTPYGQACALSGGRL